MRGVIAEEGLESWRLAIQLDLHPSRLSRYLREREPMPAAIAKKLTAILIKGARSAE
jgi:hypothetical protein